MCNHNWIPFRIEPEHPVSVNTSVIHGEITGFRVVEIICTECSEVKQIAESPRAEASRIIEEYRKGEENS